MGRAQRKRSGTTSRGEKRIACEFSWCDFDAEPEVVCRGEVPLSCCVCQSTWGWVWTSKGTASSTNFPVAIIDCTGKCFRRLREEEESESNIRLAIRLGLGG